MSVAVSEWAPWPCFGEALTGAEAGSRRVHEGRVNLGTRGLRFLQMRLGFRKRTHFLFQK